MILPADSTPPPPTSAEMRIIVARLQDFLAEYIKEGRHLGIKVSTAQLLGVIDEALRRMKKEGDPAPLEQTPVAYFLDGFCEALLQEQQGLYEKTKDAEGRENFTPVNDVVWVSCLKALRDATAALPK